MQIFRISKKEIKVFVHIVRAFDKFGRAITMRFRENHILLIVFDNRSSSYAQIRIAGILNSFGSDDATNDDNRLQDEGHCITLAAAKRVVNLCGTESKMATSVKILIDKRKESFVFTVYFEELESRTRTVKYKIVHNLNDSEHSPTSHEITAPQALFSNVIRCLKLQKGITFKVSYKYVLLRPYKAPNEKNSVVSQVLLLDSQFTKYSVEEKVDLHFRVSYLKAILAFAKAMKALVTLNFDAPASLVLFRLTSESYRAKFFLRPFDGPEIELPQKPSLKQTRTQNRRQSLDSSSNEDRLTSMSHQNLTQQQQMLTPRIILTRAQISGAPSNKRTRQS